LLEEPPGGVSKDGFETALTRLLSVRIELRNPDERSDIRDSCRIRQRSPGIAALTRATIP